MNKGRALSAALLLWLATLCGAAWAQAGATGAATGSVTHQGVLAATWADPNPRWPGQPGARLWQLHRRQGPPLRLHQSAALDLQPYLGQRVQVTVAAPVATAGALGATVASPKQGVQDQGLQVLDVKVLDVPTQSSATASAAASSTETRLGTRRLLHVLLRFADDAQVPHPPRFYLDLSNPAQPPAGLASPVTINGFFKAASWGQLDWQADVVGVGGLGAPGGWFTLAHPRSHYVPCDSGVCADTWGLAQEGLQLARSQGVDLSAYDTVSLVVSNDLDCCAWGGATVFEGRYWAATWMPAWGQEAGAWAHELGHALGLLHSGWVYQAYDHPWDTMSDRLSGHQTACGSYRSAVLQADTTLWCTEPANGYIAPHKEVLGWIPEAQLLRTNTLHSTRVTLQAGSGPLGSGIQMLKICLPLQACDGPLARYMTVEARVRGAENAVLADGGVPASGVLVHHVQRSRAPVSGPCFASDASGWAWPVDGHPGDFDRDVCIGTGSSWADSGLYNAHMVPGQSYNNRTWGFKLTVVAATADGFEVLLRNTKADQRINPLQTRPGVVPLGGQAKLLASATSGLTVAVSSLTPARCRVLGQGAARQVQGLQAGTCQLRATQAGNGQFNPAPAWVGSVRVR